MANCWSRMLSLTLGISLFSPFAVLCRANWTEVGASVGTTSGMGYQLVPDVKGGVVAVWKETSGLSTIKGQRIDRAGNLQWPSPAEFQVSGFNSWAACEDGQNGFVAVLDGSGSAALMAQRFDANGKRAWGPAGKTLMYAGAACPAIKGLARMTNGQYVLLYTQLRSAYIQLYAIRLDSTGQAIGDPAGTTVTTSANSKYDIWMGRAPQGDVYIFWMENDGTNAWTGQRYNASGAPVWPKTRVLNPGYATGTNLDIKVDAAGHIYSVFQNGMEIFANRIDPEGTTPWAQAVSLAPADANNKTNPQAGFFPDGALLGSFCDRAGIPISSTTVIQRVEPDGTRAWGSSGRAVDVNPGANSIPELAPAGAYVWQFWSANLGNASIYAKRIFPDGTVQTVALDSLKAYYSGGMGGMATTFTTNGVFTLGYERSENMYSPRFFYVLPWRVATNLSPLTVPANTYYNGETDQPVLNVQVSAVVEDQLNAIKVVNSRSAVSPADIRRCSLWRQSAAGAFDPAQAVCIDRLQTLPDGVTYVNSAAYQPVTVAAGDQLFVTADVAQTLTPGRFCQFSLPAGGISWDSQNQLPTTAFTNAKSQYLTQLYNLKCDATGLLAGRRTPGEKSVKVYQLAFSNASNSDCNLKELRLNAQDGLGRPLGVFPWVSAWRVNGQPVQASGSPIAGDLTLSFASPVLIPVFGQSALAVEMDLAENLPAGTLQLVIGAQGFLDPTGQTIAVDRSNGTFPITSGVVKIVLPDAASSLSVYPNPAVLSRAPANIGVYLENTSTVDVGIYTLDGSLVRQLAKGEQHPRGQTAWQWDGVNDAGRRVVSGVYGMRMSIVQDGRTRVLTKKIAVAR
jgi:hypothetical protein